MDRFNKDALESMQHGLYEYWETDVGMIQNEK